MLIRYIYIEFLLSVFVFSSIVTYFSVAYSIGFLKPIAVLSQLYVLLASFLIVHRSKCVNYRVALWYLIPLCLYPFISTWLDIWKEGTLKALTDALFLEANFIALPIIALAMICESIHRREPFSSALKRPLIISTVVFALLFAAGFMELSSNLVGNAYSLANNLLLPLVFLSFIGSGFKLSPLLIISTSAMLLISTIIGSRSYLVVVISMLFISIFQGTTLYITLRLILVSVISSVLLLIIGDLAAETISNTTLYEKLRLDSLQLIIVEAINKGNPFILWEWEGNSRQQIIEDAFSGMGLIEYMFGAGLFATYQSFVERNTIEIGWAQLQYWFGFLYMISIALSALYSYFDLNYWSKFKLGVFSSALIIILLARTIDGFVYGMPTYDLYNLLFWISIMFSCLKNPAKVRFLEIQSLRADRRRRPRHVSLRPIVTGRVR